MGTVAAELLGLFAAFPAQPLSEATAEARARHFLAAVGGFSLAAIRRAIGFWMRGEHASRNDNHSFPPSPPQLARLCRIAQAPMLAEIERLEALAMAEPVAAPPEPAAAARVAALADQFRRGCQPSQETAAMPAPTASPDHPITSEGENA